MKIYLVGGAVRDKLLGLPVKERDWVVTGATPDDLLKLGYKQVGKDFPVFLHPETNEEYALARTERKTGSGYTGFTCNTDPTVTLEEDLRRRDLTVNAIAEDLDGHRIDPYGGQNDLAAKVLRHISPAFEEDPLRVLRIARFSARFGEFTIADETLALMKKMADSGELTTLVAERIWKELVRALQTDYPQRFFHVLRDCHALKSLMPEVDQLFGVPQKPEFHPEIDTGIHTMMVLELAAKLSPDPLIRFAALLHDLGKGITPKDQLPSHAGHEARGIPLIKALCQRLRVPRDYEELAILACAHHTECHKIFEATPEAILQFLHATDAFRRSERFKMFVFICEIDSRGRPGYAESAYPQHPFLLNLLEATKNIPVKPLIDQGLQHQAIGQAIDRLRLEIIRKHLEENT